MRIGRDGSPVFHQRDELPRGDIQSHAEQVRETAGCDRLQVPDDRNDLRGPGLMPKRLRADCFLPDRDVFRLRIPGPVELVLVLQRCLPDVLQRERSLPVGEPGGKQPELDSFGRFLLRGRERRRKRFHHLPPGKRQPALRLRLRRHPGPGVRLLDAGQLRPAFRRSHVRSRRGQRIHEGHVLHTRRRLVSLFS